MERAAGFVSASPAALPCIFLITSLTACVSPSEANHQNFKSIMQHQVGRSIDHPDAYRNRYPVVASRTLLNGNTEEEFETGRRLKCRAFFEIDNKAGKIVSWRYEGSKQDCSIAL